MLTELILYSNQIECLPKDFSLPILKLLKLSMNKISTFRIGFCPFLETIDVKDNLISQIEPLAGCVTLKTFDVSFNQLQSLAPILIAFSFGPKTLQHLKFNDNPFVANRYNILEGYIARMFDGLKEINNLNVSQCKNVCTLSQPQILFKMYGNEDEVKNTAFG
jgi:Leucine-rich repeat (LRR) protein